MQQKTCTVKELFAKPAEYIDNPVMISGWIRTVRVSKNFGFLEVNDGSAFTNVQIVFEDNLSNFDEVAKISIGSSLVVQGKFVESVGAKQPYEIKAENVEIVGMATPDNPIQKKRHTFEFLRTIPHLRLRTNTYMAVFRVRSLLAQAIHEFFQQQNFVYIHTPIITSIDAEGAGEMFRVSTFPPNEIPRQENGSPDYSKELLGQKTYLTVSGQLAVEAFCMGFRDVYTFGPTFRAENSNTPRHANEFWMIEPEIAFADLQDDMDLAEAMVKHLIGDILEKAPQEMDFFNKFIDKELISRLENVLNAEFATITYTKAIDILKKSNEKFEYPTEWGENLQTEHERFLAEKVFNSPVFVTDYPKGVKAFYMRLNDDQKTVRAVDLLAPGVGEIIGGSQREERYDVLLHRMKEENFPAQEYSWYLDIRKFGTFPHAGFGLGFERALMYLTGMKNIRDVIPYPRTPNNAMC